MSISRTLVCLSAATILAILRNPVDAESCNLQPRIIGGSEAEPGEFPFIAALYVENTDGFAVFNCAGSIIDSRHILTAAHCVVKRRLSSVALGCHDRAQCTSTYKVGEFKAHPNYQRRENDVALLCLDRPIQLVPGGGWGSVEAIQMADSLGDDYVAGEELQVAGWGKTSGQGHTEQRLRKLNVRTVSLEACKRTFKRVDEKVICFEGKAESTCRGDSGGPVIRELCSGLRLLVGIVSYGRKGCNSGSVKMRVAAYIDWIRATIRAWEREEVRNFDFGPGFDSDWTGH